MLQTGYCLSLALLFLASGVPSKAQSEGAAGAQAAGGGVVVPVDMEPVYYEVRGTLSLNCSGLTDDKTLSIVWKKNDTLVEEHSELKDRHELSKDRQVFSVKGRAREEDYGNYTCAAGGAVRAFSVRGRVHAKLPANTNVVEGQKLKLQCKLVGKPYPNVTWVYANDSSAANNETLDVVAAFGPRVQLKESDQHVPNADLVIDPAQRSDAGWYTCVPAAEGGQLGSSASTTLRVKDMYAALWPFLGICAEVFVLCAIILVYEKRRTKPELDDSDTDNHDQKKS